MAGAEDLSWDILKFAWSKGSAVLRAQANIQLQSLDLTGRKHKTFKTVVSIVM